MLAVLAAALRSGGRPRALDGLAISLESEMQSVRLLQEL